MASSNNGTDDSVMVHQQQQIKTLDSTMKIHQQSQDLLNHLANSTMDNTHQFHINHDQTKISHSNQTTSLIENSALLSVPYPYIFIVVLALLLIIWRIKKSRSKARNKIVLVGQRFSGKTQLFIQLNKGKKFATVPSIKTNHSLFKMQNKTYHFYDYCGDDFSKDQIISNIEQTHTIIHVVDGTDTSKLTQVASFIYRALVNTTFQKNPPNYILFFNKTELPNFLGVPRIQKKIEDQIEHIKASRRNQALQKENQEDYLKISKTRFELRKTQIKLVSGSAIENINELLETLGNL